MKTTQRYELFVNDAYELKKLSNLLIDEEAVLIDALLKGGTRCDTNAVLYEGC